MENVREYLSEPREYFYDAVKGEVLYLPASGEDMNALECIIPVAESLVSHNNSARHRWVGVIFEHATWLRPSDGIGYAEIQSGACAAAPVGAGRVAPAPNGPHKCGTIAEGAH